MKKVLGYSLLILLLALLLNIETARNNRSASPYADATGTIDILAFSTGEGLPDYRYLPGQIKCDNTILVEDLVLRSPEKLSGLWVAMFDQQFDLLGHQRFDLCGDPLAIPSFLKHFRNRPLDTTAVLLVQRNLQSEQEDGMIVYSNELFDIALHDGYFDPGQTPYRQLPDFQGWRGLEKGKAFGNTYSWTNGTKGTFSMWISQPEDGVISVCGYGIKDKGSPRHLSLKINGKPIAEQNLKSYLSTMDFPVSASDLNSGLNYFELSTERTVSPFQARGAPDDRPLGIMVDFVHFLASTNTLQPSNTDPHPGNRERIGGMVDPGLAGYLPNLETKEWYGREKGKNGRTYAWTRDKIVQIEMPLITQGAGDIVVTGYGAADSLGTRLLTLKANGETLDTINLSSTLEEMRFPITSSLNSRDTLTLTLELNRLVDAPGNDSRVLGMLVDDIRFEKLGSPPYIYYPVPGKLWLHNQRPILLPGDALENSTLHLAWDASPTHGNPDLEIRIFDKMTGQFVFEQSITTVDNNEIMVKIPDNLPDSTMLFLGVPQADKGQGLFLTRLVLEYATSDNLDQLFTSLGAQEKPWLDKNGSWTLVTTKRPAGWVPLSESHSLTSGVMSAVTILPDRTIYDNYRGEYRHIDPQ